MTRTLALSLVFAALFFTPATAQDIAEKAQACAACHGENGKSTDPAIPVIWGQHQGYLYLQLRDFKLGNRKNEIMNPMAADMSRQEMMAYAEYFSKQKWPNTAQKRASTEDSNRAQQAGIAGQCGACHGSGYLGDGTNPRIAGQNHDYLEKTLFEFRNKVRTNNPWMSDILGTLKEEDLKSLASYIAGL